MSKFWPLRLPERAPDPAPEEKPPRPPECRPPAPDMPLFGADSRTGDGEQFDPCGSPPVRSKSTLSRQLGLGLLEDAMGRVQDQERSDEMGAGT